MLLDTVKEIIQEHRNDPEWLLERCIGQAEIISELQQQVGQVQSALEVSKVVIDQQRQRLAEAEEKREQAEREGKRQAAPFRKPEEKRKQHPKKPGRKNGHPAANREIPEKIDATEEVPLCACPHCNCEEFQGIQELVQYILEIPEVETKCVKVVTYKGQCTGCGADIESDHPLKTSSATGAAAVQFGPNALAFAAELNKPLGLTVRNTCRVLKLFGLSISPGGLSRAMQRVARKLQPDYEALLQELINSKVAYMDETSWWMGEPAWLWVITNEERTFYLVADSRGRDVIHQTLGSDYEGVLVSDCLNIYDNATKNQHKCYSHHLKAISEAIDDHPLKGAGYLYQIRLLLKDAMDLKPFRELVVPEQFDDFISELEDRARILLATPRDDPGEEAIRNRLEKQDDHLFTFLRHDEVDATNNLAERQLRPAVIARKLSCGNKTSVGANAFQILASLAATCKQRGMSFIDTVVDALRSPPDLRPTIPPNS